MRTAATASGATKDSQGGRSYFIRFSPLEPVESSVGQVANLPQFGRLPTCLTVLIGGPYATRANTSDARTERAVHAGRILPIRAVPPPTPAPQRVACHGTGN